MNKEKLKLALDALENHSGNYKLSEVECVKHEAVVEAIKEALAQPDQYAKGYADAMNWKTANHLEHLPVAQPEPVALQMDVIVVNLVREGINKHRARELAEHFIKNTTPPQRTQVDLTDEEVLGLFGKFTGMTGKGWLDLYRMTEAKRKEKNT